jgi:hypothetical protein
MDDQGAGGVKKLAAEVLERVEPAEARFGIELSGVAAFYEVGYGSPRLTIKGEASSEENPDEVLEIAVLAYDRAGDVVGVGSKLLGSKPFPGIAGFEVTAHNVTSEPVRIKVFPAVWG